MQVARQTGRWLSIAVLLGVAAVVSACEKPDASYVTSPSALALLGTTEGEVRTASIPPPPRLTSEAPGWDFDLGNARFSKLENDVPSIQVVTQVISQPGAQMQMWLFSGGAPVFYWEGGTTRGYNGVVCFQLALASGSQTIPLGSEEHSLRIAFVDRKTGVPLVAKEVRIAGFVPELSRTFPEGAEPPGVKLLGCPRSVI